MPWRAAAAVEIGVSLAHRIDGNETTATGKTGILEQSAQCLEGHKSPTHRLGGPWDQVIVPVRLELLLAAAVDD